jgi:TIR domain
MAQIFLSYSSADRNRAEVLKDWFESLGWSVFWDREIPPGENWESYLLAHLDQAACVVVLWTPAAYESDWVIKEAIAALERGRLVQIKGTGLPAPPPFDAIQALPFQAWAAEEDHPQMARLIKEVARRLGGGPPRSNPVTPSPSPSHADRYEVASAVFHYCAAMVTFRLRQIAGTPQSAAALAEAYRNWSGS